MRIINQVLSLILLFTFCFVMAYKKKNSEEPTSPKSSSLSVTVKETRISQIPGQPYVEDPELSGYENDCTRLWHELPPKAEAGEAEAQNQLAHLYYDNYNWDCSWASPDAEYIGQSPDGHDPKKALDLFLKSAEQGNTDSMFMAGLMYLEGPAFYNYPEQDSKKAEKWFLKATDKGSAAAALGLTRIYAQGLGMPKDPQKARKWAYWALKQNPSNTSPNYYLGLLAIDDKNYVQARQFFVACTGEKTEEIEWVTHECRHASYQLSKLYEQGLGVKKDLKKAAELYNNARSRDDLPPMLTPDEDIKRVALDRLWHIAVYKKDPLAQYELGRRYEAGEGVAKDKVRATEWYARAAERNNPDALYALAMIDVDDTKGNDHYCVIDWLPERLELLQRAEKQGHKQAAYELGKIYQHGAYIGGNSVTNGCLGWGWRYSDVVIGRDKEKAKYYFEKSGMEPPAEE